MRGRADKKYSDIRLDMKYNAKATEGVKNFDLVHDEQLLAEDLPHDLNKHDRIVYALDCEHAPIPSLSQSTSAIAGVAH